METNDKHYKRYLNLVDDLGKKEATLQVMEEFNLSGNWKNLYKRFERKRGNIKDNRFCVSDEEKELIIGIREHAKEHKIGIPHIKHLWTKSKGASLFVKNPAFEGQEDGVTIKDIEKAVDSVLNNFDYLKQSKPIQIKKVNQKALKVTTSDDHLGLEPNPKGNGLFNYEYNGEIYKSSFDKVFESILKEYNTHGTFDLLLIDNLGDQEDGFNGQTVRGGHSLEQNMTNAEVVETVIDTKIKLLSKVVQHKIAKKIILRKCVNDNHSGDFGHTINIAIKKLTNLLYDKTIVEVETLTRFLEHRNYGDHCFILTHGKDKDKMFKGLPLQLNDKTIKFINDYINFYQIKSKYIHVEKGDLHQIGYNKCNTFDYRNFMSFAPPSSWVQHNFGDCYSGYSIQVIPKHTNEISHTDYFLDYKKVN